RRTRRGGRVPRVAGLLRPAEREEQHARPAALHGPQDIPGGTAHETGPDEHGGLDREPRALPGSPPRGVRDRAAGTDETARSDDEVDPARIGEVDPPEGDPHPQEDGLPGALLSLAP